MWLNNLTITAPVAVLLPVGIESVTVIFDWRTANGAIRI